MQIENPQSTIDAYEIIPLSPKKAISFILNRNTTNDTIANKKILFYTS